LDKSFRRIKWQDYDNEWQERIQPELSNQVASPTVSIAEHSDTLSIIGAAPVWRLPWRNVRLRCRRRVL
jgi:hypothetical protein